MYAARRDRRQRDRDQQRAAANRRIGHEYAYAIVAGPFVTKLVALAALAGALVWVWYHVDHHRIALVVGALGLICVLIWTGWFVTAGSPAARNAALMRGKLPGSGWPWYATAVAGVLLLAAAFLIWQP